MPLILELKYKQNNDYCIVYKDRNLTVSKQELIDIIHRTEAINRNCKISNNNISMKAGYGKLRIKRLIKSKDYVEIVDIDSVRDEYIDAVKDYNERDFKEYAKYSNISKILRLENIIITDLKNGIIKTKFGLTTDNNLSSGMKSLLVLYWYIKHNKDITIDLSSCGAKHLEVAFKMIVDSGLNIRVVLRHLSVNYITTKIKYDNKIMNNDEYLDYVMNKEG